MKVSIIGGGIIGLFSAYYLQQKGVEVEIFDRGDLLDGCSHGNAGMIVPSHFIPLAAPGMIAKGIRWMFNPESPFYVRPRLSRELFSWAWQFYKASTAKKVQEAVPVLRDISLLSKRLYQDLAAQAAFDFAFEEKGLLMLYKTAKMESEELHVAEMANNIGIAAKILSADEVSAMEPDLTLNIRGGVYYPGDAHLHPNQLLKALKSYLQQQGVQFYPHTEITGFDLHKNKLTAMHSHHGKHSVEELLIAGGAWSQALVRQLGRQLPIQAGKGYSFTLPEPKQLPRYPSILAEAKVAVTPMGAQLRFAGTMEIGGINQHINPRRVDGILKSIPEFLPAFQLKQPITSGLWSGLRPCSPDGKPYIGRLSPYQNLSIASGHAMMGLSLAPATGHLIAQLLGGEATEMELQVFSPNRYA